MAESHEQQAGASTAPVAHHFPVEQREPEQAYASLSIMALIGFGIGVLYAVFVLQMAVVAFFSSKPLLFSGWSVLVPLSGVLLSAVALVRIRRSEGTLAGRVLARWGLMLSLFVGLCYHAYTAAVYFAVRQQARHFTEAWMERVSNRDITSAAMSVLPPAQRVSVENEDEAERSRQFDLLMGEGGPGNPMEQFRQHKLVRLLFQAGPGEVQLKSKGVRSWRYTKGGYEVAFTYTITTPDGQFEGVITVLGTEADDNEFKGRQWQVLMPKTHLDERETVLHPSEAGVAALQLGRQGQAFLRSWEEKMPSSTRIESFLMTLPEEEREQARKDLLQARGIGALGGPLAAALPKTGGTVARYNRFLEGSLVEVDTQRFLADEKTREAVTARVRKLFSATVLVGAFKMAEIPPLRSRAGDKLLLAYDMQFTDGVSIVAEGVFEVECDPRALESPDAKPQWRLVRIRLVGGRTKEAMHSNPRMKGPGANPDRLPAP
jgi:hypothetical protein